MTSSRKNDSAKIVAEAATHPTDLSTCSISLVKAVSKGVEEIVAPFELSTLHFAVLRRFLHREKWTSTELLKLIPVGAPRMSRIVAKLVERRLLRRRRLRNDRRVVILALTQEGTSLTNDMDLRMREYEASLTAGVTEEELAVFFRVTQRILLNDADRTGTRPTARRAGANLDVPQLLES